MTKRRCASVEKRRRVGLEAAWFNQFEVKDRPAEACEPRESHVFETWFQHFHKTRASVPERKWVKSVHGVSSVGGGLHRRLETKTKPFWGHCLGRPQLPGWPRPGVGGVQVQIRPDADRVEARKAERVAVKALDEHIKTQPLGTRAGSLRATEASIAARLDALKRSRGSGEELAELIQEELARTPARERSKLLGYFERWCDRQFEILLEESSPATRMIQ